MKYRVIGSNKDTGARMVLEFEADSKAAAERKATQSGMVVNHAAPISDGTGQTEPAGYRGPVKTRSGMMPKLAILIVVVIVVYLLRGPILNLIHHGGH